MNLNSAKFKFTLAVAIAAASHFSVTASAQTITGTPGTPSATTTINGLQIPVPPP
ncbi:hypothetical protein AB9F29_14145 [Falsihalocynthiibacter sp. S25ZX9]|uniref:hypothetical protein n=1 Tax=Falsihalocynthiibacter sp. S25ZX9 TaxID=3240870 RepID=UPI003510C455